MTRKQMRDFVLRSIDERTSNTGLETHFSETEINDLLEMRYDEEMAVIRSTRADLYAKRTDGSSTAHLTMTVDENLISLPADFGEVLISAELIIGDEVVTPPLVYEPYVTLMKRNNNLSGQPERFAFVGSQIYLWPIPPEAGYIRLTYCYVPTFPSSDTEVTFPKGYGMVVPYKVLLDCSYKAGLHPDIIALINRESDRLSMALRLHLAKGRQVYNAASKFSGEIKVVT